MGEWKSKNHSKYLLQYHLIFVCKYRKQLLSSNSISSDIKSLSECICKKHNVIIRYMETDKDHIHYMIETEPNINLSDFVRTIKIIPHIIFGRNIAIIFSGAFGKNILSGQMDILYVP